VEAIHAAFDLTCKTMQVNRKWEQKTADQQASHFKRLIADNVQTLIGS
jgi:hypothetical protein